MKRVLAAAGLAAVLLAGPAVADTPRHWRVDLQGPIAFRGLPALDGGQVGAAPPVLYPAPNLAGFLAAVLAHGLVSSGAEEARRRAAQEAADASWQPLATLRDGLRSADWWKAALARPQAPAGSLLADAAGPEPAGWVATAVPSLSITRDAELLVLDLGLKLPAADGQPAREQLVRVLSAPTGHAAPADHWLADEGRAFRSTVDDLLAHALELAVRHGAPAADAPERTWRYAMGRGQGSERAQLVAGSCARLVLRTLRGWLLSVPALPEGGACSAPPYALGP